MEPIYTPDENIRGIGMSPKQLSAPIISTNDFDDSMKVKLEEVKGKGVPESDAIDIVRELKKRGKLTPNVEEPGLLKQAGQTLIKKGQELGNTLGGAAQKTKQAFVEGAEGIGANIQKGISGEISPSSAIARTISSGVSTAFSPITGVLGQAVEETAKVTPDPVKDAIEGKIKEANTLYEGLPTDQKERLKDVGAGLNILTSGVGVKTAPKIISGIEEGVGAIKSVPTKIGEGVSKGKEAIKESTSGAVNKVATKAEKMGDELIYEAVNPTKIENKKILRQRLDDLKPYIEDTANFTRNDLDNVKARVDADKATAGQNIQKYESEVGVKGQVDTSKIIKKIEDTYMEKIGKSYINKEAARIAEDLIDTLKGFGKIVSDDNIVKVRRAWDDIESKNKGFMLSSEATKKGEIFGDANKFFREEIHASNPEYSRYLNDYSRTKILSDVLGATIERKTGQSAGGFLRQTGENTARVTGAGLGGFIGGPLGGVAGYLATEGLIKAVRTFSGAGAKLTTAKKLSKLKNNGVGNRDLRNTSAKLGNSAIQQGVKEPKIVKPKGKVGELKPKKK